jgi:hypothetical protein
VSVESASSGFQLFDDRFADKHFTFGKKVRLFFFQDFLTAKMYTSNHLQDIPFLSNIIIGARPAHVH